MAPSTTKLAARRFEMGQQMFTLRKKNKSLSLLYDRDYMISAAAVTAKHATKFELIQTTNLASSKYLKIPPSHQFRWICFVLIKTNGPGKRSSGQIYIRLHLLFS